LEKVAPLDGEDLSIRKRQMIHRRQARRDSEAVAEGEETGEGGGDGPSGDGGDEKRAFTVGHQSSEGGEQQPEELRARPRQMQGTAPPAMAEFVFFPNGGGLMGGGAEASAEATFE